MQSKRLSLPIGRTLPYRLATFLYVLAFAWPAVPVWGTDASVTEAASGTVLEGVMVPMRDGTCLATDVYLPGGGGPWPAILMRTPYGRGGCKPFADACNGFGMAAVAQNTRGRGGSYGRDMVFGDDGWGTCQDGVDTAAWIRAQDWSDGRIAGWGASALAITQNLLAGTGEPLVAQVMWVGSSDFYGQLAYQGGVFRKSMCERWSKGQGSSHILESWHEHPTDDGFWWFYDTEARAAAITAPGLHVGGWWDIFCQGTINSFVTRQHNGGEGAKGRQMLVMGAWAHGPVAEYGGFKMPANYNYDFNGLGMRFLRHYVAGNEAGMADEPAVRYYTLGDVEDPEAPGNEWRTADDWPPFATTETPFYLVPDGSLAREPQPAADNACTTYTYDPADPCPTRGGANLYREETGIGPADQRELAERADVLVFMTPPLDEPVEITGRVKVRLCVSTDAPDTDFTAKLLDVYPDGRQMLMLDGIRRLKFHRGYRKADPLPPGEVGLLEIDLWTISLIVNKGHRIGLHVSSSNYPRFEKNPNTGEDLPVEGGELRVANNTVYMDEEHPSALLLPIPSSDSTDADPAISQKSGP